MSFLTFFNCQKPMMTQLFFHLTKTVFLTIFKIPVVAVLILDTLYGVYGRNVK